MSNGHQEKECHHAISWDGFCNVCSRYVDYAKRPAENDYTLSELTDVVKLYQYLERRAIAADKTDDEMAESIRSLMDFVWKKRLTKPQRDFLNSRGVINHLKR